MRTKIKQTKESLMLHCAVNIVPLLSLCVLNSVVQVTENDDCVTVNYCFG